MRASRVGQYEVADRRELHLSRILVQRAYMIRDHGTAALVTEPASASGLHFAPRVVRRATHFLLAQDASAGTVRVRAGETSTTVQLALPATGKYQVMVTPTFNSGSIWVANQSMTAFTVQLMGAAATRS